MTKYRHDPDLGWVVEPEPAGHAVRDRPTSAEVLDDTIRNPVFVPIRTIAEAAFNTYTGEACVSNITFRDGSEDFFKISQDKGLEVADWSKIAELKAKWDEGETTLVNAYAAALWHARNSP